MNISPAKENILKKIRKALTHTTPIPFPNSEGNNSVFQQSQKEPEIEFAERFSELDGKFIFCLDHQEMVSQLKNVLDHNKWDHIFCAEEKLKSILTTNGYQHSFTDDLAKCDASITSCEFLVARTGSIVLSSNQSHGRTASVYAPVHICIAYTNQLVYDIKETLISVKEKYPGGLPSLITFATGPSRTADIEKTLVVGVHGPAQVFVFLIDSPAG